MQNFEQPTGGFSQLPGVLNLVRNFLLSAQDFEKSPYLFVKSELPFLPCSTMLKILIKDLLAHDSCFSEDYYCPSILFIDVIEASDRPEFEEVIFDREKGIQKKMNSVENNKLHIFIFYTKSNENPVRKTFYDDGMNLFDYIYLTEDFVEQYISLE